MNFVLMFFCLTTIPSLSKITIPVSVLSNYRCVESLIFHSAWCLRLSNGILHLHENLFMAANFDIHEDLLVERIVGRVTSININLEELD